MSLPRINSRAMSQHHSEVDLVSKYMYKDDKVDISNPIKE